MARAPVSTPHTKAWMALEQNLKSLSHMLALGTREITLVKTGAMRLNKTPIGDLSKGTQRAKLLRTLRRFNATLQLRLERYGTATLWQVVMLVTCIEAYLQDLLVAAASVDPEFMSKSKQVAPYADVVSATSLDELANELRQRWARGWLSDGGPTHWISSLDKMGAKHYPVGLAARLELIWGIRHVTVHTAGVATADFLKRHPGAAGAVGDRVRVSSGQFKAFLETGRDFLEPTERFFLARCPSLLASTSSERVK
jgi:hypothetical protein